MSSESGIPDQGDASGARTKARICAATITLHRPALLQGLLDNLKALQAPEGMELCFLVVDNDPQGSAAPAVAAFAREAPGEVVYVVEAERGIPFARNRALVEAEAMGAAYLAFIDDDETADPDWLVQLAGAARSRGLDLVGGPVRCKAWTATAKPSLWQRLVFDGIRARYTAKERSASRRYRQGEEGSIVIVTNNWLLDLAWLKRTRLRFDERLRRTGGSDALFYREAKTLGIESGWSEAALVHESVPLSRSTLHYQFDRARHQSMASFRRNHPTVTAGAAALAVISSLAKAIGSGACLVAVPFLGGTALVQAARQAGWMAGRLQALAGRRSTLYSTVDGA